MTKYPILFITCMIFLLSVVNFSSAQDKPQDNIIIEKIDNVIQKLNMKILLNKQQQEKLKVILVREFTKDSIAADNSKRLSSLNDKVDDLLTERQKNKFKILKSNWLNELINPEEKATSEIQ